MNLEIPEVLTKKYWIDKGKMDLRNEKPLSPVKSGYPITSITLDLTTACPLNCSYCFTNLSKGKYKISDLTLEQGKKTIDWLLKPEVRGDSKEVDIAFWGGEPLARFDLIKDLVLYGEKRGTEEGVRVSFNGTTNVVLFTQEKIDFFKEHNILFLLSIDGRKETHDRHRVFKDGSGSFDVIDKNIDAILKAWPYAQVRLSYSEENIETFAEDVKYLYERGFQHIAYSPVCEGEWPEEKLEALRNTWDEIADWWLDLRKKGSAPYIKYIKDGCTTSVFPEGKHSPCGAGRGYVGIATDGSIYPCHRFHKFNDDREWYEKEYCLGHIDYGILNQEWRENFIKWDSDRDLPSKCKSCPSWKVNCNGGCWATNWDLNDTLSHSPEVFCVTENKNLEIGKRLIEGEMGEAIKRDYGIRQRGFSGNVLPMVQGCQCYNIEDNLFGRKTVNTTEPYSCLCNMSTYGIPPQYPVKSCDCYNVEDTYVTHWDNQDLECKHYASEDEPKLYDNPIKAAIEYLRDENIMLENLSEVQKNDILEFEELLNVNQIRKDLLNGDK